jgi:C-terminal processing protease CtpA/Prc
MRLRCAVALALAVGALPSCSHGDEPVETILDLDREFAHGSGVELDSLSVEQVEHLVVLGKVWGFLKYHHRQVTSGQVHWDFELFRVLPSVLAATDATQRNEMLLRWIVSLGPIVNCRNRCASPPSGDVHLQPRIEWIRDEALLGAELSRTLEDVWKNRPTGEQFWVSTTFSAGNVALDRELAYAELEHVDAGYRILAAFRLWNLVEYWFPYRDQIEEDWDGVLRELLPVFARARERTAYELALAQLIAHVHDSHAQLFSTDAHPPAGPCGLRLTVRFIDGQAVVVEAGPDTMLLPGDVVLALDGRAVEDLIDEWRPYLSASNEWTRLRDLRLILARGECGPAAITIDRDGRKLGLSLERVPDWKPEPRNAWVDDRPGDTFQLLGEQVAYIKLSTIERADVGGYIKAAAGTKGLVIDVRNYPNAEVLDKLGGHLVDMRTGFVRYTYPDLSNPGAFLWTDMQGLSRKRPHYTGKIVVLVNELTQSAAEHHTMAFRAAPGAIVIGSPTAGADGNVSRFALPGDEWTIFSGLGVFWPDKRPTQRVGIVPDILATPTREGIRDGRDEVLERALREILGPEVPEDQIRELARPPE